MGSQGTGHSWRVVAHDWENLHPAAQRIFLVFVGESRGEWWGGGSAQFPDYESALRCYAGLRGGIACELVCWSRHGLLSSVGTRLPSRLTNIA